MTKPIYEKCSLNRVQLTVVRTQFVTQIRLNFLLLFAVKLNGRHIR